MKQIPILLLDHLQGHATTWCYLMRIACKGKYAGIVRGFTSLDDDVEFDDGAGLIVYKSDNGFMPAKFQRTADFSVDNTDVKGWIRDEQITEQDILAGIFDFAEVTFYRVNYKNLAQGAEVIDHGSLGQTILGYNTWKCEFRSLTQQAKQPHGDVYSITCRARYGDGRCKMPFEWVEGEVTGEASNNLLEFIDSALNYEDGHFAPGVLEWISGGNAGADMDVDMTWADGGVRLVLPMGLPIKPGDRYRIRIDCDKFFETCKARGNYLQFDGEHLTPVSDTGLNVPGTYAKRATTGGGGGSFVDTPPTQEM